MLPYLQFGESVLPTYGLFMTMGIVVSVSIMCIQSYKRDMDVDSLLIIFASTMGMALFGSRLLYAIVTYGMGAVIEQTLLGNNILIEANGQVFYGGLIFGIVGARLGAQIAKANLTEYYDIVVPYIPLGHALGRVGCYFAGCCYGCQYNGIGSIKVVVDGITKTYFPIQLLESVINVLISMLLIMYSKKNRRQNVLELYLCLYASARLIIEFFRGDELRGIIGRLSISQWISVVILVRFIFCNRAIACSMEERK